MAWSALEVLALGARPGAAGALVVVLGVRELAGQLSVGRDAAAKALTTLRDFGVISAVQQRAGRGRFDGTRHTVLLPVMAELSLTSRAGLEGHDMRERSHHRRHSRSSTTRQVLRART